MADNILNRDFTAKQPNEKWLADVTKYKSESGRKAYLSAILDIYDGYIVSYEVGVSYNNPLVLHTLDKNLEAYLGAKTLLHSDRVGGINTPPSHSMIKSALRKLFKACHE